jgi:hypothetical protein
MLAWLPCLLLLLTALLTPLPPPAHHRNNENLARLACKIVSPVIFAHVRAAYPGMPVSEQNCHPFQWGRYLWMHNGVVGGFNIVKRALLATLSDAAFNSIQSFHSDSAVAFAIFLSHLPDVEAQHPPDVLLRAMQVGACPSKCWGTGFRGVKHAQRRMGHQCCVMQCCAYSLLTSSPAANRQKVCGMCSLHLRTAGSVDLLLLDRLLRLLLRCLAAYHCAAGHGVHHLPRAGGVWRHRDVTPQLCGQ